MMVYRVHPLVFGHVQEPEPRIFYLGDCGRTIDLVNMFFLIKGEGVTAVVDTGVSKADGDAFNPSMEQSAEEDPIQLLKSHDVSPEDITHVIATHLHWDHISPTVLSFMNAKVYVHPAEIIMALAPPHPWFAKFIYTSVVRKLVESGRMIETPDGTTILPGIRTLWTGGHTSGSQAVLVDTVKGRAVLTGDVCFTYRNLEEDIPGGFNSNLIECFDGLAKIRRAGEIILPSHDPLVVKRYPNGL